MKREVEVLRRLRGCLNVAALEDVYEDDSHVHLVRAWFTSALLLPVGLLAG